MNTIHKSLTAVRGAAFMVGSGASYAGVNVMTQWMGNHLGMPSVTIALLQYSIAAIITLACIRPARIFELRTRHLGCHLIRTCLVAAGIQLWVYALDHIPIWQAIALSMTTPFFVISAAHWFLREKITALRLAMTFLGFIGALIIIAPGSKLYNAYSLLPLAAAALWAGYSIITKHLTRLERPSAISLYMLLLITPFNGAVWLTFNGGLPASARSSTEIWLPLIALGALTALAQYLQAIAYSAADVAFLQPFDDLRLPINVLLAWLVFATKPTNEFWLGAALIVGASLFLLRRESLEVQLE